MKEDKILVTGGSGFIGTNLIEYLAKLNYEILNIDISKPKIRSHVKYWCECDICDKDLLQDTLSRFKPNYIIHLAAKTDLNGKELVDYNANIVGVENLLKASYSLENLHKIIITSSMLVCKVGYIPQNQFDYKPTTIYGESKVLTEKKVWENQPTCDWAIIRPTSIWGPYFKEPYRNFFDYVIKGRYFHIGNKSCTKTYGYIENSVNQVLALLNTKTLSVDNKVFYIGDYKETNVEIWADEIANELGKRVRKIPFFFVIVIALFGDLLKLFGFDFPMSSFRLKNMTTNNIVDLENTYELCNDIKLVARKEGIKKTLKWILENK